ncbi:MAG: SSS family solute:Na+ symporter [Myxococcota bacterium]|jgi:SSS family solute:Na+ symporter
MTSAPIVLAVVLAYLAASVVIGLWPGGRAGPDAAGYVAGDRGLGLVVMYFITGATVFSAFAFLGGPGWAYSKGVAALYILAYGTVGFVPFWFLGPRAARLGRRFGYVTPAQMVADRFALPPLALVMAGVSLAAFVPYLALQMKGAGYVLDTVSGGAIPEAAGAALVYGLVLLYVVRSGVLGVGWTNTFQGVFMMALAWGLGLYLPWRLYGGVGPMFARIAAERPELLVAPGLTSSGGPWSWGEYSSAVLVSAIGFSAWPHLFMKAFTARDDRTLRRTVVLYPTFQVFLVPLFLIGFAGVLFGSAPERADQILPHMLMNMELPALVVGLFCAGALAASMSSGDAMAHAAASIVVRDGWIAGLGRSLTPVAELRAIRVAVVAVIGVSYAVAVAYEGSLVMLLLSAYGAVVQFAPALVATLFIRRATGVGVFTGLVVGSAVTIALVVWPELRPWGVHAGLYGLVANVAVVVVGSWLTRPPADADAVLQVAAGG